MATLHLARPHAATDAPPVVVKRILPQLAGDAELVGRFLDEARLAATLDHPNIVKVVDVGAGAPWFAMEWLHGEDVRRIMEELQRQGRAMPLDVALTILLGAASGLAYAHRRGIVHRDVAPQNLLVTYQGGVKLVDFGIARAARRPLASGAPLAGRVGYFSPEQCRGLPVDRRSDVFSLSVVLWEMTCGRRLYRAAMGQDDAAVLRQIADEDAPLPSSVVPGYPALLEQIVQKGLERDPARRWQSAEEMQAALESFARVQHLSPSTARLAAFLDDLFAAAQPLPAGAEDTMETPLAPVESVPADLTRTTGVVGAMRDERRWLWLVLVGLALVFAVLGAAFLAWSIRAPTTLR